MKLSHAIRCPLKVSPFLSSTSWNTFQTQGLAVSLYSAATLSLLVSRTIGLPWAACSSAKGSIVYCGLMLAARLARAVTQHGSESCRTFTEEKERVALPLRDGAGSDR